MLQHERYMTEEKYLTPLQRERAEARKFALKKFEESPNEKKSVLCRMIAQEIRAKFPLLSFWTDQNVRNVINKHEKVIKDWRSLV